MSLSSSHRWILVGKLLVRNNKKSASFAPQFELDSLIHALRDSSHNHDHYKVYENNTRIMYCSIIEEDENYYKLIIEVGDKDIADAAYLNFQTGQSRNIDKEEDEGGHYSAHILLKKQKDSIGRHILLLERAPGISFTSVQRYFRWVCNKERFKEYVEDEKGNKKSYLPTFELTGFQSKTIREALNDGKLQDIEFIKHSEVFPDGLDEEGLIQAVDYQAKWEIRRSVSDEEANKIFNLLSPFKDFFNDNDDPTKIFVKIKASNGSEKKTEITHGKEEVLEQAFIQNEVVNNFETPLPQSYECIREDMIAKMVLLASNLD
ncbi:hypothetical protein NBRC116602_21250 [Hyphomicrobiales bacterium 4NK60-0047b]